MILTLAIAAAAGCTRDGPDEAASAPEDAEPKAPPPPVGSLEWAVAGPWRVAPERDRWRHPLETLKFWGLAPGMTVVEVLPGRGWYTSILAPYLSRNGGKLYAASFDPATATPAQTQTLDYYREKFLSDPQTFGSITMTVLSPKGGAIAPAQSADLVIVARNVHTMLGEGYAETAFAEIARALKPGGVLGVEQHRASSTGLPDPQASNGYVQESVVKLLAQEVGLEFVGSSEINANPRDDRDHPFGVWTLPPTLATAPVGEPPNPRFDTEPYAAIGESDRMTLKFRKPGAPAPAPAEPPKEDAAKKGRR